MSALMLVVWYCGTLPLGVYLVFINFFRPGQGLLALPLIMQPFFFCLLALLCYTQSIYYERRVHVNSAIAAYVCMCLLSVVFCVALYFTLIEAEIHSVSWFVEFIAILPAVTLGLGFLPQLVNIFREKRVALSLGFVCMDILGGAFSILSLVLTDPAHVDIFALCSYGSVVFMQSLIIVLYFFYTFHSSPPKTCFPRNLTDSTTNSSDDMPWFSS
eukprot:Sdes_comp13307_c0_seq1m3133